MFTLPNPLSLHGRDRWRRGLTQWLWTPSLWLAKLHRASLSRRSRVVLVTGTYGKTTTTRAIRRALGLDDAPRFNLSRNCWAGVSMELGRQASRGGSAVIEVGVGSPGDMARYARVLRPDIAVVTAVGADHLASNSFADVEAIRDEKGQAVRGLRDGGVAVLNRDDPLVMSMARLTTGRVITFGFDDAADVVAESMTLDWPRGSTLRLRLGDQRWTLRTELIGQPMAYALLAAMAAAHAAGVDLNRAAAGLEGMPATPGRLQPVPLPSRAIVLRDDFKATVDTVASALRTLADIPARRRFMLMAPISTPPKPVGATYRRMGEQIGRTVDRLVLVGFKSNRVGALRSAAVKSGLDRQHITITHSVHEAIELLRGELGPDDVLLIKGQGNQRLERVALALAGHVVKCSVTVCSLTGLHCDQCPMLNRGGVSHGQ